nr:hypothetical protein L204_03226 [Cryptococcus depauperatus CBS 7855]
MSIPPPIPARSKARAPPTPKLNLALEPSPILSDTHSMPSTPNYLALGSPLFPSQFPSQHSGQRQSSLPQELEAKMSSLASPSTIHFSASPTLSGPGGRSPLVGGPSPFGKRRASRMMDKDPHKVRDGVEKKNASSGVYTPPTFPGPCGHQSPRVPTTPSDSYATPRITYRNTFESMPISPSSSGRSSSTDHSDSTAPPRTPMSPSNRISKLTHNVKRLSSMAALNFASKERKASGGTFDRERDLFFPPVAHSYSSSSISHSRQLSWDHYSSNTSYTSCTSPSPIPTPTPGLGISMEETRPTSASATVIFDGMEGKGMLSPVQKGKRKPVPKLENEL